MAYTDDALQHNLSQPLGWGAKRRLGGGSQGVAEVWDFFG